MIRRVLATLPALAALAAAGCVAATEADDTARGGGLTATLAVTPAAVAPGESLTVRFALANPGPSAVRATFACTAPAMLALRRAGDASNESLNGSLCGGAITERTIAAGGEVAMAMRLAASQASYPPPDRPLAAGRYVVEATPMLSAVDGRAATIGPLRAELVVR